jgi:hypothetical protein
MRPLVIYSYIYYNIFQFFLQKRYSEADFVMKVAWKIALYNLVFHQLPLIKHCTCSIFYKKKMPFRVPKFLGEFNGKICSECISYNLEFHFFWMLNISPLELHLMYTFNALFKKTTTPRTSMISVFLFRKKTTAK